MTKTKPGRHPLRESPGPIRQEPLTPISIDQPVTDLGVENGQTREQMRQDPIDLIISETLPLHAPQRIEAGVTEIGSETGNPERKSEKFPGPASTLVEQLLQCLLVLMGQGILGA